ncbi:MAG: DUF2628 domain-containing protein [Ruminococcus sp.]|nr:DUF2628 domain-containing protein [Ruminococcus sp.]
MDYIGYKCPVCNENFHANEDIVVCPQCGTPHHRVCYEVSNHCANEDKHGTDFDFINSEKSNDIPEGAVKCKACGNINPEGTFFCTKCKTPLVDIPENQANTQNRSVPPQNPYGIPFGFPFGNNNGQNSADGFGTFQFDPMAGVSPEAEFENGAKAGEVAKYVKQNTTYFMQVFNKIKNFDKSRFSFVGLLFGGGYFLYRKQYFLGTILTLIMAACMIFSTYGSYQIFAQLANEEVSVNNYTQLGMILMEKMQNSDFYVITTVICQTITYAIHIVCGCIANRCYYKHCCKQVNKIKTEAKDTTQSDKELQTKGGVNVALGTSLLIVWLLIDIVPSMLL